MLTANPDLVESFLILQKCIDTEPSVQKSILSSDKTIGIVRRSSELLLITPFGAKSEGLVIQSMATRVTVFKRRCFNDNLELSPQCSKRRVNGSTGIGLDFLIGKKVFVFTRPDTKRLMSVLCVGHDFPNASNKHHVAATADFNTDSGL